MVDESWSFIVLKFQPEQALFYIQNNIRFLN